MDDCHSDWETLTDPILLAVFSYLDVQNLCAASRTCKNWWRISLDESLWKALASQRVGCRYVCHDDVTWKSELKRLIYHAPVHLHRTCQEHHGEIYYICFSNSGNLIATCGEDGIVNVWKYGNEIQLLFSRQVVDGPGYVNYVEFNQAETHLIAHCITMGEEFLRFDGIIMVLSIHTGALCPVAARNSGFAPFRGTWLANDTFLNTDVLEDSPDDVQFLACKFFNNASEYSSMNDLIAKENVETKTVLQINQLDSDPEFVKVIDWSLWNGGDSNDSGVHSETNEKVVILYLNNLSQTNENKLKFYRVDLDSTDPVISEPITTIRMNCLGLQLSADHRYLVCNTRRITVEDNNWRIEKDVITMVIPLGNTETTPEIYGENQPIESSSMSTYFFPHVSSDYVAAESDPDVIFLWDRKSRQTISKLSHRLPGQKNGVSAVAFHPRDQEVLVTVADDCKLRVWKSGNRLNSIATDTMR